MRSRFVVLWVCAIAVATLPAAAQPVDPLTPQQVVEKLQTVYRAAMAGDVGTESMEQMQDLVLFPEDQEEAEKLGGGFWLMLPVLVLAPPPANPGQIDGDAATVAVQTRPLEVVLVQKDGKWKVDMVATYNHLPEDLRKALEPSEETSQQRSCLANLKQLGLGVMMYAQDNDQKLPDAGKWRDQILPYTQNEQIFKCPAAPDLECAYAMNAALSGMKLADIEDWSQVVLFFESNLGVRNATAGPEAVADPPRHKGGNNYAFADGHVKWLAEAPSFAIVKAGEGPPNLVVEVTDGTFKAEVLDAPGWVLVDFSGTWCDPCLRLKPVFHKMSGEYEGRVKFVSLDVDQCEKTADKYGAPPIPLIILFRDGKIVDKQLGYGEEQDFRAWVAGHVK